MTPIVAVWRPTAGPFILRESRLLALVYAARVTIRVLPPKRLAPCELLDATHQFATEMIKASTPRPYKTEDLLVILGMLGLESYFYASAVRELRCRQ